MTDDIDRPWTLIADAMAEETKTIRQELLDKGVKHTAYDEASLVLESLAHNKKFVGAMMIILDGLGFSPDRATFNSLINGMTGYDAESTWLAHQAFGTPEGRA